MYGKCDGLQWDYDKGTCNVGKALTAEDYDTIAGLGTVTEAIEYLERQDGICTLCEPDGYFSVSQGKCGEDPVSVSVR